MGTLADIYWQLLEKSGVVRVRNPNISRLDSRIAFFGPSGQPVTLGDLVRMAPHALVALIMLYALCAWAVV